MKRLALLLLLLPTALAAQPQIPDAATKKCALMRAYHLNGDSMVRMGSIDLSGEPDVCGKTVRTIPILPPIITDGKMLPAPPPEKFR